MTAAMLVLEPIFEAGLPPEIYAYRAGRRNTVGEVKQLIGVSSDITARKTSELEREGLLVELASERMAFGVDADA